MVHISEFLGEANQALKHQYVHNLRDPYFEVVTRGQCLAFPGSESFMQFRGQLAMMFSNHGKHIKVVTTTSAMANSDGASTEIMDNNYESLSYDSHRCQHKINAWDTEIAAVKTELNWALEENQKLKKVFYPDWLFNVLSKGI